MGYQSACDHAPEHGAPSLGPIRQLVLKIHSRCNLRCDHCYVYTGADQSWRKQPNTISTVTTDQVAKRIAEHAETHALAEFRIVLHGGEPLLAGAGAIEYVAKTVRALVPTYTRVQLAIQTNGVLLDRHFLDLFDKYQISVGVSLDGDRAANDRHRVYSRGQSSYSAVRRALQLLSDNRHRSLYSGLLCTVDLRNDPVGTYESLLEHSPPRLDLLLPHGNWSALPPGLDNSSHTTPYGTWLSAVFDRWYSAPRRETSIRLFDSIISRMLGGPTGTTAVGNDDGGLITVETDGSIERSDSLKTVASGAASLGMTVFKHTLDQVLRCHAMSATSLSGLCSRCRSCPIVSVCGGGLFAHRFQETNGFDNPSVYCTDLYRLIQHIRMKLQADLQRLQLASGEIQQNV